MHIYGTVALLKVIAPNFFHKKFTSENDTAISQKCFQYFILLVCQLNHFIIYKNKMFFFIYGYFIICKSWNLTAFYTAKNGFYSADKLHNTKWLSNIIIGAHIESLCGIDFPCLGSDHNNRQILVCRIFSDFFENFQSVIFRQHNVKNNQRRLFFSHSGKKLFAGLKLANLKIGVDKCITLQLSDTAVVLYYIDKVFHIFLLNFVLHQIFFKHLEKVFVILIFDSFQIRMGLIASVGQFDNANSKI